MHWLRSPLHRLLLCVLVVFVLLGTWVYSETWPLGGHGRLVMVDVHSGETVSQLATDLQTRHVIGSALLFRMDAVMFGAPFLRPGTVAVYENSSFFEVKSVFTSPSLMVNVRAGLTIREIALNQLVADKGRTFASNFLAATHRAALASPFHPGNSLEGLIGLGLYVLQPGETPRELVHQMTSRFLRQAARAGIVPGTNVEGLTPYQLVIGASIVEN